MLMLFCQNLIYNKNILIISGCSTTNNIDTTNNRIDVCKEIFTPIHNKIKWPNYIGILDENNIKKSKSLVTIQLVSPSYPGKCFVCKVNGFVNLAFVVEANGTASNIQIVEATNEYFANSAITAIRMSKFRPAELDGKPIATKAFKKFHFELN
jgi:TonB family protein